LKNCLSTKTVGVFIALFILAACIGPLSQQTIPTATISPTALPTLTLSPPHAPVLLGTYPILSPEDMRYDLDELFHRIEMTHPNPYTKRSKAEVDLDRQRIYEELGQPMSMLEFYAKVTPLINSLGDFHTQVYIPADSVGNPDEELFFPLELKLDGQKWFIAKNYSGNPDSLLDAEVLSINGTDLPDIQDRVVPFIKSGQPFPFALWFVHGSLPTYQVEILPVGQKTPQTLEIPGKSFTELMKNQAVSPTNEAVTYSKIPDESIGILAINSFMEIGPLLKPAFVQIQKDGIQHLIIDIRANGGGEAPSNLMDYLTDQPYRLCSKYYEAPFKGYGSGQPREKECELIQPFDAAERFKGQLYLLIGPDTFSAAITFATILQDYHLATLIGEQTTDTASYCAGATAVLPLPRTKLEYRVSTKCFVRPSGVLNNKPVIPDILVKTTIQDKINGTDPVLDYTLKLIRDGQ
jgi:hypothetical protein